MTKDSPQNLISPTFTARLSSVWQTPREVVRVNLDSDAGGIYRYHSTEELPAELPEAPDLATEVPLDLRPATQVNVSRPASHTGQFESPSPPHRSV